MRQAGEVTYADTHKGRRNEGVIEFRLYSDMKRALEKLDGTEVNGRKIRLIEDRPGAKRRRSYSRSRSRSRWDTPLLLYMTSWFMLMFMNIARMNAEVYLHITEWCFIAQIYKKKGCAWLLIVVLLSIRSRSRSRRSRKSRSRSESSSRSRSHSRWVVETLKAGILNQIHVVSVVKWDVSKR